MPATMKKKMRKSKPSNVDINKRGGFDQTMDQSISNVPTKATIMATTTTAMAATSSPDPEDSANQTRRSVRHAITVRRKITSKLSVTKKRDNAPLVKVQELDGKENKGNNIETVFKSKN